MKKHMKRPAVIAITAATLSSSIALLGWLGWQQSWVTYAVIGGLVLLLMTGRKAVARRQRIAKIRKRLEDVTQAQEGCQEAAMNKSPTLHWTPIKVSDTYVLMLCQFELCVSCSKPMVPKTPANRKIFPQYVDYGLEGQMERGGLAFRSGSTDEEGRTICEECEKQGKSTFRCALCGTRRPSSEIQESFGAEGSKEHLCKTCFEPARKYCEAVRKLIKDHQWEFE